MLNSDEFTNNEPVELNRKKNDNNNNNKDIMCIVLFL